MHADDAEPRENAAHRNVPHLAVTGQSQRDQLTYDRYTDWQQDQGRIVRHCHYDYSRYKQSDSGYQTNVPSLSCVWIRAAMVLVAAAIEHR